MLVKPVKIIKASSFQNDERGKINNFILSKKFNKFAIIHRKKNSISGSHFHKGITESKKPEVILLVRGSIKLSAVWIRESNNSYKKYGRVFEYMLNAPLICEIQAMVYHEIIALTDIILIEYSLIDDDISIDLFKIK